MENALKRALPLLLLFAAAAAFGSYQSPASTPSRNILQLPSFQSQELEPRPDVLLVYDDQGILDLIAYRDAESELVHVFEPLACEASAESACGDEKSGGWSQNRVTCRRGNKLQDGATTGFADGFENALWGHSRYYDPELGRFTQPDPMGYEDSMNLYQAFGQSPQNFGDPMGLQNAAGVTPYAMKSYLLRYYGTQELMNTLNNIAAYKGFEFMDAGAIAESVNTQWSTYLTNISLLEARIEGWEAAGALEKEYEAASAVPYLGTAAPIPIVEKAKQAANAFLALPGQAREATQAFWRNDQPNVDAEMYAAGMDIYQNMGRQYGQTWGDVYGAGAEGVTTLAQGEAVGIALKGTAAVMALAGSIRTGGSGVLLGEYMPRVRAAGEATGLRVWPARNWDAWVSAGVESKKNLRWLNDQIRAGVDIFSLGKTPGFERGNYFRQEVSLLLKHGYRRRFERMIDVPNFGQVPLYKWVKR